VNVHPAVTAAAIAMCSSVVFRMNSSERRIWRNHRPHGKHERDHRAHEEQGLGDAGLHALADGQRTTEHGDVQH
jgi:hypothetical protein